MKQSDFVFNQVYKAALRAGATERAAKDAAVMAIDDYKKNKYQGRPSKLIEAYIKKAVKAV